VTNSGTDDAGPSSSVPAKFLQQLAHDIRSPVGVLQHALQELEHRDSPHDRAAMVAMARRSLSRLLRLAERLSIITELDRGVDFQMQETTLHPKLESAIALAVALHGRRTIDVVRNLGDADLRFTCDPCWLHIALSELVANALRFARSKVRVSVHHFPKFLEIHIEDDGQGFSPEFASPKNPRATPGLDGAPVSLSLAQRVCEGHGGVLRFEASSLLPYRDAIVGARVVMVLAR
jgi:two-component system, OmpR family, sensor histidine kinase RstB